MIAKRLEYTYAELFDAIEKNGYKQTFYRYHAPFSSSFCALGQASKNLGFSSSEVGDSLLDELKSTMYEPNILSYQIAKHIIYLNDDERKPLPVIAAMCRSKFHDYLQNTFTVKRKK